MSNNPHLPLELIFHIIEASLPTRGSQFIASVSTPEAQLLVAWSQVCRVTYEPATRLLRQHFMYIDTITRLRKLLRGLSVSSSTSTPLPTIPLGGITSFYLGLGEEAIQETVTGSSIRSLFIELGSSLRRLILDIPFYRLDPDHELVTYFNQQLSEGLSALSNVEEFVTVGGLPSIDFWSDESPLWERWPRLRRMAGFQVELAGEALWHNIARARMLEHVVLARPYLLRRQKWNFKHAISKHWRLESGGDPSHARRITIVLADHEFSPPIIDTADSETSDPLGLVSVSKFDVKIADIMSTRTEHACREWMILAAREDTLWRHQPNTGW